MTFTIPEVAIILALSIGSTCVILMRKIHQVAQEARADGWADGCAHGIAVAQRERIEGAPPLHLVGTVVGPVAFKPTGAERR